MSDMGISILDKIIDSLHLSFLLKTGNKKTTNQAAGRDINNIMVVVDKNSENSQDLIVERTQKLMEGKKSSTSTLSVVLGTFLGIVKSAEKPGTRLHLDFAVMNSADKPSVIQGSYIKLDKGIVHCKKFYKSNSNGSREPDMSQGFPIIINSKGATKLQIEFENIAEALVQKGDNKGEVFILAEGNILSSRKFSLPVDEAMIRTLQDSQNSADTTGVPSIFLATIHGLG